MESVNKPTEPDELGKTGDAGPILGDAEANRISRRRTLISMTVFGGYLAATYGGWRWLQSRPLADGIPWPYRKALQFNERVSRLIYRENSAVDRRPPGSAPVGQTWLNSNVGVDPDWMGMDYGLHLSGLAAGTDVTLSLADLKAFPKVVQTTRLCCVEGWSTWANWGGCRLRDVIAKHPPATGLDYVGMATRGNDYYVGLDLPSATHERTLLVYELDGKPLGTEHGAPVRLAIPTKYGIKNIKQPATLAYAASRPADYWAEQGYDWYSGL